MSDLPPDLPLGLKHTEGRNARLAAAIASGQIVTAPGAFDCIGARLVEVAGFDAVYVTGSGVSMSLLGAPDVGVVSFAEQADAVARIADAVSIPVIADADTGYGGTANIFRTVRAYERAGVSAIQIEDQDWPKKCGHEPGRRLVPLAEATARIAAAAAARHDPKMQIIARTDARSLEGLDAALERAARYRDAGADVLFVESPESAEELARIPAALAAPCLANMVEGGRTPIVGVPALQQMGFAIAIFPNALTRLFARTGLALLDELSRTGTTAGFADRMLDHRGLWDLFENPKWTALDARFRPETNT